MQEVRVVQAQNVKKGGKTIQKSQTIKLFKEIPSKPDQNFFKCNGLTFEKGGILMFRSKNSDNIVLTYNDYIQKSGPQKSNSANLLSRGEIEGCYPFDTPYTHLLDDFANMKSDECLSNYFDWDTYWLKDDLQIKFMDKSVASNSLVFIDKNNKSIEFKIKTNVLTINSIEFPEEDTFDIYLNINGSRESVAEGIRIINLPKLIVRLRNEKYSNDEIENILIQNYFTEAFVNDVRQKEFFDLISNIAYSNYR